MATFLKPCWSSNPRGKTHTLDNEEYIKKNNKVLNWKIPKVPTSKIYKTKPFTFFTDPSIITKEVDISCENGSQAFNLISLHPIIDGIKKKKFYTMFNLGMIQIGVKTLTSKIPSNASIILCVLDTRVDTFKDSILGLVETNLRDGPMYFNVFPNISMSLLDPRLLEALSLIVVVEGFELCPKGTRPISLMWRSCYKLKGSVLPHALVESPQGKTTFFQTSFEDSNDVAVQKVSVWEGVIIDKLLDLFLSAEK